MSIEIYRKLARHLDNLPGGYPATQSGVELRILQRLFTPEQAELALHLTLIPEEAPVIAYRAKITPGEAAARLQEMEKKGLLYATHAPDKPPQYMATQFAVGIYELQLHKLYPELAQDLEEYLPILIDPEIWRQAPQMRTIPVGESIDAQLQVMPYERAEELLRGHTRFSVAECICRQERRILGEDCGKPLETCLSFGSSAEFYQRNGLGRMISQEEALAILKLAEQAGLVLQPNNAQKATFLCACCGCCCGVLRNLKRHPRPASLVHSPFRVEADQGLCDGCETCLERCQMEALYLDDGFVTRDVDRCIGCGLCVSACPTGALSLRRKPEAEQPYLPKDSMETNLRLGQARGVLGFKDLAGMMERSREDRRLAQSASAQD